MRSCQALKTLGFNDLSFFSRLPSYRIASYGQERPDKGKYEGTVGGILSKVLKQCMGLTPHEISHAKFTPGGLMMKRGDDQTALWIRDDKHHCTHPG